MPKKPARKTAAVSPDAPKRLQVTLPRRLWDRVHACGNRGSRYGSPSALIAAVLDCHLEFYERDGGKS